MAQPRVVQLDYKSAEPRTRDDRGAWKWLGWFAGLLMFVALSDFLLAWIPFRFGTPEWEFATVVQTFSGLPLVTIGSAGLLGAGIALGHRGIVRAMSFVFLAYAVMILLALGLFMLDVPLALRAAGPAIIGVWKAIAKTVLLGTVFSIAYALAAIFGFRRLSTLKRV